MDKELLKAVAVTLGTVAANLAANDIIMKGNKKLFNNKRKKENDKLGKDWTKEESDKIFNKILVEEFAANIGEITVADFAISKIGEKILEAVIKEA